MEKLLPMAAIAFVAILGNRMLPDRRQTRKPAMNSSASYDMARVCCQSSRFENSNEGDGPPWGGAFPYRL